MIQNLLTPYKLGAIPIRNRIGMAAMSRQRCDNPQYIPNDLMVEYYSQRSSAGFIITEGIPISIQSIAFPGSACLFNIEQADGWKRITQGVHQNGGKIIAQLWHSGRATCTQLAGSLIAPSPIRVNQPYEVPKEMSKGDIQNVIQEFVNSEKLAKYAEFDGIQLHAGTGYIIDQFLRANKRNDEYGGSIQNRCKFCLELLDAVSQIYPIQQIGIKISPIGRSNDMFDDNPIELFSHLLKEVESRNIGFVELKDDNDPENFLNFGYPSSKSQIEDVFKTFRPKYKGCLIGNYSILIIIQLTLQLSESSIYLIPIQQRGSNMARELAKWDNSTFLTEGPKGYIDYPKL
ncbi:hypothetical protein pb186bvf_008544 [Paramecium bursaria]